MMKTKIYSNVDTCVSGDYLSPTEDKRQGNSKYEDENDTKVLELPTVESDLSPVESTILINNCRGSMFFILKPSASAYIDNC